MGPVCSDLLRKWVGFSVELFSSRSLNPLPQSKGAAGSPDGRRRRRKRMEEPRNGIPYVRHYRPRKWVWFSDELNFPGVGTCHALEYILG